MEVGSFDAVLAEPEVLEEHGGDRKQFGGGAEDSADGLHAAYGPLCSDGRHAIFARSGEVAAPDRVPWCALHRWAEFTPAWRRVVSLGTVIGESRRLVRVSNRPRGARLPWPEPGNFAREEEASGDSVFHTLRLVDPLRDTRADVGGRPATADDIAAVDNTVLLFLALEWRPGFGVFRLVFYQDASLLVAPSSGVGASPRMIDLFWLEAAKID